MENANLQIMVLNGWAASPHAWNLCAFMRASAIESGFSSTPPPAFIRTSWLNRFGA